jgi:type I restriction enzyme S subunit
VRHLDRRLLLCDKLYRLQFDERQVDAEYAVALLRSTPARQLINSAATGQSTLRNIGQDFVRGMVFAWPPLQEQQDIIRAIQRAVAHVDEAARLLGAQLVRMHEYRQALITAAVTGQIDVTQDSTPPLSASPSPASIRE